MISWQGRGLRLLLNVRRRLIDWEAPVDRFRAMMARGGRAFGPPRDAEVRPVSADGVPCEWLIPIGATPRPVLLYLHGGGWTLGWTDIHRRLAADLARAAGGRALAVNYRLAPEHPFPAALHDCLSAYTWLLMEGVDPREIAIAGDSAGGNLTLAVLLALIDAREPLPAAGVGLAPMTDLLGMGESFRTDRDPTLRPGFALTMARHYAGDEDPRSPLLSPFYGDLRGLPPLLIQVGALDILRSDAERFAEKARAAGVDVRLEVWPEMWHVWQLFAPVLPEGRRAIEAVGAFLRERIATA